MSTKYNWDFFVGLRKGIAGTLFRMDDEGPMHCGPEPGAVSMPPQRPFLVLDCEPVRVAPPGHYWTLSHIFRPISPSCPVLMDSVPENNNNNNNMKNSTS